MTNVFPYTSYTHTTPRPPLRQLRAMLVEPLLPSGGSTKFLSSHARFEDVMAITTRHRSLAADKTGGNRRRRKRRNR